MSYKKFSPLGQIIPGAAKKYNLEQAVLNHKIFSAWEKAVTAFVSDAKDMTKATDFHQGRLVIACLSEKLASDIKMFTDRILHALNQMLGNKVVFSLVVEV